MVKPYAVMLIHPMTVRRHDTLDLIEAILDSCPVSLVKLRTWDMCNTTQTVLVDITKDTPEPFVRPQQALSHKWVICLFQNRDVLDLNNPYFDLKEVCGPQPFEQWQRAHIRMRFSKAPKAPSLKEFDPVLSLIDPKKSKLAAQLLFQNFDEQDL